jgi:phosphoribosylaminoimidazolecarboxamide formyltransferase/IMP cyclohydrolase
MIKIKRALISVSDKTGIIDLARDLRKHKVEIISTGGTSKVLKDAGIPVMDISEVTGFPEMLDGRVKTLHPKIHGGLLYLRNNADHEGQIKKHEINAIDMIVVNLYPFEKTVADKNVKLEHAIENIDIGGPSMIRSASKNFHSVCVLTNPADYKQIIHEMDTHEGAVTSDTMKKLMVAAFRYTYEYDRNIYNFFSRVFEHGEMPETINISMRKSQKLRYGENPHQRAAFYIDENIKEPSISNSKQLHGKELSYNNIMDADSAIELVKEFLDPAAVIIKHTNPCGTAIGKDINDAFLKAYESDPLSAFGGIIVLNRQATVKIAEYLAGKFTEVIIAPSYEKSALELLKNKKDIRILVVEGIDKPAVRSGEYELRKVVGGLLVQERDLKEITEPELKIVTKKTPSAKEMKDMLFAWSVVKHVKSNAIVIAKDGIILGVGAGQMNRVGSVKIASEHSGNKSKGAVLASDALFPKADSITAAEKAGISAIIQTGGSVKDEEVIEAADKAGIAMVMTGIRHFKH